jgi:uncharacterized membrane protein
MINSVISGFLLSDFSLFLGRFHPTFLHLPIGFLLIAFGMEVFSRFRKYQHLRYSVSFVLFFGAGSAIVAALMGYFLAEEGGYNENLLLVHQWLGIGTAVMATFMFLLRWRMNNRPELIFAKSYLFLWLFLLATLTLAGHYGGSLTHGESYLTEHLPAPIKQFTGMPAIAKKERKKPENMNEAVVFEDVIMPILEKKCVQCHNPDKTKGDLMMASMEGFVKGGEHGAIFKAGNAKESEVHIVVTLPREDEHAMPPDGKEPMTEDEVKLLAWWINEGADFKKKVGELKVSEEIAKILGVGAGGAPASVAKQSVPDILPTLQAKSAENAVIEALSKDKIDISPIANGSPFLQVKVNQDFSEAKLDALQKIAAQTTWLDLKRTNITDSQLKKLATLKNLTELRLEMTNISDEGLKNLESLTNLQYLNLYGTKVTDAGLKSLEKLPNLRSVYLWQTGVSKAGAESLQTAKPQLKIDLGLDKIALDSLSAKK